MKLRILNAVLMDWKSKINSPLLNKAIGPYTRPQDFTIIDVTRYKDEELLLLKQCAEASTGRRTKQTSRKITQYLDVKQGGVLDVVVKNLEHFELLLRARVEGLPNQWLFSQTEAAEDYPLPYYVESTEFHPKRPKQPPYVSVVLKYVRSGEEKTRKLNFFTRDIRGGRTVAQILLSEEALAFEDEKLVDDYELTKAVYDKTYRQTGEQFLAYGQGESASGYYGSRSMEVDGVPSKVVIDDLLSDEEHDRNRNTSEIFANTLFWEGNPEADDDLSHMVEPEEEDEGSKDVSKQAAVALPVLPTHCFVDVFRLEDHVHYSVHINDLQPYVWNPKLIDKLVLDAEMKELVDILVSSAGEVLEDIVAGKTGGTIVLCSGSPGTGKTLTAEVYSEVMKRPLYMVQCSQLGTDEKTIESKLAKVLKRATRWKAILLIDEADVYTRERGTDIMQNAIVGVFLRTLERYRGVLFLTTNRATVVDDAILSRLTAHIRYQMPDKEDRLQLWRILSENYNVQLPPGLDEDLAKEFAVSGRSIKNMLKLAGVILKKKSGKPTLKLFQQLVKFQDVEQAKS